ncbi:YARHG domain-containing protein [Hymenobacter sp. BRD67]|uniref:YARHG domain-containing protein n=1 Tax=Hymenobacter sp. BRD67 TaxID=2675877 RepID=UPI001563D10F|nr:YARHG domain-containing protein [Hymenobacter sp. BRD67]QKG53190.1 YARHG domain-containing protein [Hymenobacter sp. BRD67]
MRLPLLCLSLCFFTLGSYAQTIFGMDAMPASAFTKWITSTPKAYEGVYHFGESEWESDFALVVNNGMVTAQIRSGGWAKNPERWEKSYRILTYVKIVGNTFYSKETEGEFVTFLDEGKKAYGLRVKKSWSGSAVKRQAELGERYGQITDYYSGKYPQTSYQVLKPTELSQYSKEELALMRNEVFARYGYAFSKNEKLRLYFKKQEWYQVEKVSLDLVLTPIEKKNMVTLQVAEAQAALPK